MYVCKNIEEKNLENYFNGKVYGFSHILDTVDSSSVKFKEGVLPARSQRNHSGIGTLNQILSRRFVISSRFLMVNQQSVESTHIKGAHCKILDTKNIIQKLHSLLTEMATHLVQKLLNKLTGNPIGEKNVQNKNGTQF